MKRERKLERERNKERKEGRKKARKKERKKERVAIRDIVTPQSLLGPSTGLTGALPPARRS
jgi:hypothetical protein